MFKLIIIIIYEGVVHFTLSFTCTNSTKQNKQQCLQYWLSIHLLG